MPLSPRAPVALLLAAALVANCLVGAGRVDAASKVLDKATPGAALAAEESWHARAQAAADRYARDDDMQAAAEAFDALRRDPAFAGLDGDQRQWLLIALSFVVAELEDYGRAREHLLEAQALGPLDVDALRQLVIMDFRLDESPVAARRLAAVAKSTPGFLPDLEPQINGLLFQVLDDDAPERLELLQALFDAGGWQPVEGEASGYWHTLALMHLERGNHEAAAAAIGRIDAPYNLVSLRIDRRFDRYVDRADPRFDLRAAAERRLAFWRHRALTDPARLDPLLQQSILLLSLGRPAEVIALVDGIEATIAAAPADQPPYTDMDRRNWLLNQRAYAHRRLGNLDAAVADLERSSALDERGATNVSQVLNLASLLNRLGRAGQARAALARVGEEMSGYGRMTLEFERLRAARTLGDGAAGKAALDYLLAHADDARGLVRAALLLQGREDEVARRLVEELDGADTRDLALLDVQQFRRAPPLPGDGDAHERWLRVLERPEVRAAIERHGHRETFDVHRDESID